MTSIAPLLLIVLILVVHQVDAGFTFRATKYRRNATELSAYRKEQRRLNPFLHKFYMIDYPAETAVGKVMIGAPRKHPQSIDLSIELATDSIWLVGDKYPGLASQCNGGFTPGPSATNLKETFKASNDNFNVSGNVWQDKMSFENITTSRIFSDQKFAVIDSIISDNDINPPMPINGVIGLGWTKSKPENKIPPAIATIFNETTPDSQFYVIVLECGASNYTDRTCAVDISFGEIQPICSTLFGYTPLKYIPIYDAGFMTFDLGGAPLIYMEFAVFHNVYLKIQPDYDWDLLVYLVPCTDAKSLQPFIFTIKGKDYNVPADKYVVDIGIGNGNCALMIDQYVGYTSTDWLLGTPFLAQNCVLFDYNNDKIGFSTRN